MDAFEAYIRELRLIRSSGAAVKETSYYPALSNLLNGVGHSLKPPVRCIINIRNRGAGIPDGGLFTPDQFQRNADAEPLDPQNPSRGVVEVKGTGDDVRAVAASPQVLKYFGTYRQVLVTNYRDFVLLGEDHAGQAVTLESYRLAEDEAAFWAATANPGRFAELHGERFVEYLRRVMLHAAPLRTPQEVAWFLASYARDARLRMEHADLPELANVRATLEGALGIRFESTRGEHFFRSTLVQTLFYGVFSAWVLWSRGHEPGIGQPAFDWQKAVWELQVPMIRALFAQLATPDTLEPLGLVEVLDWTGAALNRVDRVAFFARFAEDSAVQYFYEPFLEAFDPELRRDLGVWYTPPEVIRYMVARVDHALKEVLGIADGLADPRVYVLDPCCGTGGYLVEVLRHIAATLAARGDDALGGIELKKAAMGRIFGFELLPAPFVVAHLQLGLFLQAAGVPLAQRGKERAAVYLTNALTGWTSDTGQQQLPIPAFQEEREAANRVKQQAKILVILGNPPYNSFAGVAIGEERALSDAYRRSTTTRQPQGQGLNDLYVRFFRLAEQRIVGGAGQGVVCYISNYSWLDGMSFPAMREQYLQAFDGIWIDSLNGDKYKTGKLTPDGAPDPSIFSTEWNREGIQVGTAIALLVRKADHHPAQHVHVRQFWGQGKRAELLASIDQPHPELYAQVMPPIAWGFPFTPLLAGASYAEWPTLAALFPIAYPGVKTSRDDVVVDIDRDRLEARMTRYFDRSFGHEEMRRLLPGAMERSGRFDPERTRTYLLNRGFLPEKIVRYCYRPFDMRWLYWEPETKLLDEKRTEYFLQVFAGNTWLSAGQRNRKEAFYQPQVATVLADHHIVESNVGMFPLYLRPVGLFDQSGERTPVANLSAQAASYLAGVGTPTPEDLFFHALATLHAPSYHREHAGALRQDWPRVPLPAGADALTRSAALGRQLAALLNSEVPVPGVTSGTPRPELRGIATPARIGGGALQEGDLSLTAGWGHAGQNGVTMPGKGRLVERPYTPEELATIEGSAETLGLDPAQPRELLGERTVDIYLNEIAYWRNVPLKVWAYTIGGYPAMKKWLSYREQGLLGRPLRLEEVREVQNMARRIAAILLLGPALGASYAAVAAATAAWSAPPAASLLPP